MPRPRTGGLSADAYGLVLVVDERQGSVPHQVAKISGAVNQAMHDRQPRSRLNRSIAALKRHDQSVIPTLRDWLTTSETHEAFRRLGLIQSWNLWRTAAARINAGSRAASALSTPLGGRPRSLTFSAAHDVAILATYFDNKEGLGRRPALMKAEAIVQTRKPSLAVSINPRAISRWLKAVDRIPDDDLETQAKAIMRALKKGNNGGLGDTLKD